MRKKLIEVSLPLAAINSASAREKSIRHGHPSTLHLWWARRPLAACRAVLFAQLVDDPSAWPEAFPTEAAQARERERLHGVIADMVPWEASGDERVLGRARFEIARSLARGRGEAAPERGDARAVLDYLAEHAPPVCDPFCGGGSIPLEAQRLGLRARGSDLNPVAVLVSKATCEIPPKFADMPPVNPDADPHRAWRGAEGLADDVRYYGAWMRERARARIGRLYPKVAVTAALAAARPDLAAYAGRELTVIAWLWARTVASPDPSMRGAHVPLASSFVLSSKAGRRAVVVPVVEDGGYRFTVKAGGVDAAALAAARRGTKTGRGANFTCVLSGAPISGAHIKAEGMAGRMGAAADGGCGGGEGRACLSRPDGGDGGGRAVSEPEVGARSANEQGYEHLGEWTRVRVLYLGRSLHPAPADGVDDVFRFDRRGAGTGRERLSWVRRRPRRHAREARTRRRCRRDAGAPRGRARLRRRGGDISRAGGRESCGLLERQYDLGA